MTKEWNVNQNNASDYTDACTEFVESDGKFTSFKQDSRYKKILEHVKRAESELFIESMKCPELITEDILESFKENDLYGTPEILSYDFFGDISPSTIRYIKNTLDIVDAFGKDIKNIVEIGGGYGGLCKTISCMVDFDNYVIIDLPEAAALAQKYTSKFDSLSGRVQALPFPQLDVIEGIDLVISNYAFSECSRSIQMKYYNDVILNSDNFYMIYNNITPENINSTEYLSLASESFDVTRESETRPTNHIFYGRSKNV